MFPAPVVENGNSLTAQLTLAPPVAVNRTLAIERLDYTRPGGNDRVMGRLLINRFEEPDFIWSPYKDFISVLNQNTWALGGSYIHSFSIEPHQRSPAELQQRRFALEPAASRDSDAGLRRWSYAAGKLRLLCVQERQQ